MVDVESRLEAAKVSVKNANWEIILTDPSLSKFNFSQHISDKYIMTDIISPLGQKSILYNTVSKSAENKVIVGLNFEEIDQANVATITISGDKAFFENWDVVMMDNRTGKETSLKRPQIVEVNPPIEMNKLKQMGFVDKEDRNKTHFDLYISKVN